MYTFLRRINIFFGNGGRFYYGSSLEYLRIVFISGHCDISNRKFLCSGETFVWYAIMLYIIFMFSYLIIFFGYIIAYCSFLLHMFVCFVFWGLNDSVLYGSKLPCSAPALYHSFKRIQIQFVWNHKLFTILEKKIFR